MSSKSLNQVSFVEKKIDFKINPTLEYLQRFIQASIKLGSPTIHLYVQGLVKIIYSPSFANSKPLHTRLTVGI
jgi:hypothetical protein